MTGCQKKEEPSPPKTSSEEVQKPTAEGSVAMTDQAKQERNEFVSKIQKEMDEMNTKMTELRSTAQTATGEAKVKIDQQIQSLEQDQKAAEQKLSEIQSATAEKWNEMKSGGSDAVDRFKQSMKKAKDGTS